MVSEEKPFGRDTGETLLAGGRHGSVLYPAAKRLHRVMAISGVRVLIGLGALAAAAGLNRPASGFHADAIRIPMMAIAVIGSFTNLYVIWRIRSLRSRPSSQWRTAPATAKQRRAETFQIILAVVTLLLVAAEWFTHRIVHNA